MNEGVYQGERQVDQGQVMSNRPEPMQSIGGQSEAPMPMPQQPRGILIEPKNHGYIVTVGCQSFAIEKISTLIRNLEKYLEHPSETEKKWMAGKLDL